MEKGVSEETQHAQGLSWGRHVVGPWSLRLPLAHHSLLDMDSLPFPLRWDPLGRLWTSEGLSHCPLCSLFSLCTSGRAAEKGPGSLLAPLNSLYPFIEPQKIEASEDSLS